MQQVEGLGAFHNAGDIGLVYTLGTSQDGNGTIIRRHRSRRNSPTTSRTSSTRSWAT